MKRTAVILQWYVQLAGVAQIALGLLFWTQNGLDLVGIHMLLGMTLVIALWALAILGAVARVHPGRVVLALLWGLVVIALGMAQSSILPGGAHWIVQVVHLLIGIAALAQGVSLAQAIRQGQSARQSLESSAAR